MNYNFVNISSSKFSLNSRELFKTFLPVPVGSTHIKIVNIYDNSGVLVPHSPVGDFLVDGISYANSTDLSNAIYDVIFSKGSSESLDAQQVETNRLAIIELQENEIGANHNHDSRYYTQLEVDTKFSDLPSTNGIPVKGDVDGENIKFRLADNTVIFSVDAKSFLNQGTSITFVDGVLKLKNSKGETLSSTSTDFLDLINTKVSALRTEILGGAPEALDTLFELAKALNDNENFSTDILAALGNRLRFDINNQSLSNQQKLNSYANLGIISHVNIQGAKVETTGKTDLTTFEVDDKFSFWLDNDTRYVVGKIVSLPIDLANDIDDKTKIKLAVDNLV